MKGENKMHTTNDIREALGFCEDHDLPIWTSTLHIATPTTGTVSEKRAEWRRLFRILPNVDVYPGNGGKNGQIFAKVGPITVWAGWDSQDLPYLPDALTDHIQAIVNCEE